MASPTDVCPRCDAPRVEGPECPRCGVIYARARPRMPIADAAELKPEVATASPTMADYIGLARADAARRTWHLGAEDARAELALRTFAPPLVFMAAWCVVESDTGRAIVRTLLTMWVHELGHAAAAWLCGYFAVPGPWRTLISDGGRSPAVVVLVAAAFAFLGWRGWVRRQRTSVAVAAAGLSVQLACVLLAPRRADAFITFCGDGGALVIATLLYATVYAPPGSRLREGALRWGLLAIAAATFADVLSTWLRARSDLDAMPLGEIEGIGLSDASRLLQVHGWSVGRVTSSYLALGAACAVALCVLYVLGVVAGRAALRRVAAA